MPLFLLYPPTIKPYWARWFYISAAFGAILTFLNVAHENQFNFDERMFTHFMWATNFGNLSILLGILSLGLINTRERKILCIIGILGALAAILCAFFSQTRAAWVVIVLIAFSIIFSSSTTKKNTKFILFCLISLGIALLYMKDPIVQERLDLAKIELMDTSNNNFKASLTARKELLKSAFLTISEHPITGVGAGQYKRILKSQINKGQIDPIDTFDHPHNEVIYAWTELGIFGVLGVLGFYFGPALFFYKTLRKEGGGARKGAQIGLLIILSYITFGLTDVMITAWVMESSIYILVSLMLFYTIFLNKKN
jgi:O-antigen ligase